MGLTNKLMNPTPFKVSLPYEKGIVLKLEPFGSKDLTMQQMDDFRDGKPGSENVQEVLNYFGLFLYDADRPYNNQALQALRASHRAKSERFKNAREGVLQRSVNLPGGGADVDEQLERLGFAGLRREIEVLEQQIKKYEASVTDDDGGRVVTKLDPTRTIFVMDPPTEFPSKEAMEFFLEQPENAEVRARHEEFVTAQQGAVESQGE